MSATNALGGGAVAAAATTGHGAVLRRLVEAKGSVEEADQRGQGAQKSWVKFGKRGK